MSKLNPHTQFKQIRNSTVDLTTLNTNYAEFEINLNNYPSSGWFAHGSNSLPEAVRGSINIPSGAVNAHGSGVAGYAMTASTQKGAVGVFGVGLLNANSTGGWGANFLISNSPDTIPATQTGKDSFNLQGIEIDVNCVKLPGGATPSGNVYGIGIIGASEVKPGGQIMAIHIDGIGFNQSPKIGWDYALYTEDGAVDNHAGGHAIDLGTQSTGNNTGSQSINFRSRDSGGVNRAAAITTDPGGDILLIPGANAACILEDDALNIALQTVKNGSTPYVSIPNRTDTPLLNLTANDGLRVTASKTPASASAAGVAGTICWDASYIYVCVALNTWKRTAIATW